MMILRMLVVIFRLNKLLAEYINLKKRRGKGIIQTMLETEMNDHVGYEKYARDDEPNCRNGTKPKTVRSKYGEFEVDVPQDRNSTFEPAVVKKRQKDIFGIEEQIIAMYAKGMTTKFMKNLTTRINDPIYPRNTYI